MYAFLYFDNLNPEIGELSVGSEVGVNRENYIGRRDSSGKSACVCMYACMY